MDGYLLEVPNLSENQVIANIKAVLGSTYFRQFNETGENTVIETTHLSLEAGEYRDEDYVPSPFDPLADVFNGFIDNIHNNPHLSLEYAIFNLSAPPDIKERFGFHGDKVKMDLQIKAQPYEDGTFGFVVINDEGWIGFYTHKGTGFNRKSVKLTKGRKVTNYRRWLEEVNQELQKILPHTSEPGNIEDYIKRQEEQ